jgi:predicted metallo-beta-lactamase superfamily hydrolase
MNSFDYFDQNNLQMNITFMNYFNISQSGTFDYLFDYNYFPDDIKPKINIIKRTSPLSKKNIIIDKSILRNSNSNNSLSKVRCDSKM